MKENYGYEDEEEEIINTSSSNLNSINDINNITITKKLNTINTYISPNNNIKSTNFDDNSLLNNEINIPNSTNSNYIIPNQLEDIDDININIISPRESHKSLIETSEEKLNTKIPFNIRESSLIPLSILNEKSLSLDCQFGINNSPSTLLSDFTKVNLEKILSPLLNIRKKFFRKLSISDILSFQKKEIKHSLLIIHDYNDVLISLQIFRNLLAYMGERKSKKKPQQHVIKFIKLVKLGSPILKDEAYLQIYKQLHKNKKTESYIRGLKFLAILSSTFLPNNNDIFLIILNFLFFELQNTKDKVIKNHINYIFVRLLKAKKRERKMIPCMEEIEYIESLKSIQIPVYFFNGKVNIIKIESYTTLDRDIKKILLDKLDFINNKSIFYSLYEICYKLTGTEERFLDDNEIICDVLSIWKSDIIKNKNIKENILFRFYLKLLIYYPYNESIIDSIALEYYQTVYDVISGKFNLLEEEILILGALQLVNEFGDEVEKAYINLNENYQNYIPWRYMYIMSNDQWIEKIMEFYSYFMNYSLNEIKKEYIKLLEKKETYKTQLFDCKFDENNSTDNNDEIPLECTLGFKQDGIQVFNNQKGKNNFL